MTALPPKMNMTKALTNRGAAPSAKRGVWLSRAKVVQDTEVRWRSGMVCLVDNNELEFFRFKQMQNL